MTATPLSQPHSGRALHAAGARTALRAAGVLLIASMVVFLAAIPLEAFSARTAAVHSAAHELGIESYQNGVLPIEVYAQVLAAHRSPLDLVMIVLSVLAWALFAAGIWRASGSAASGHRILRVLSRIGALSAVTLWLVMIVLEQVLIAQGGTGFSAGFYGSWLLAEALLTVAASLAVLGIALLLRRRPLGRWFTVVVAVLAGLTAVGSILTVAAGGLPPIIGPLLGLVLGIGLLIRTRRPSPIA